MGSHLPLQACMFYFVNHRGRSTGSRHSRVIVIGIAVKHHSAVAQLAETGEADQDSGRVIWRFRAP